MAQRLAQQPVVAATHPGEHPVHALRQARPPGAFGQSHPALAEQIALLVQGLVPDGARVLELYAGSGPLGLGLLPRVRFRQRASRSRACGVSPARSR